MVFRARFLKALNEAGLSIPQGVPGKWIVDCSNVGKGITAIKYLSRYLYRGVISEKSIIAAGIIGRPTICNNQEILSTILHDENRPYLS